MTNPFTKVVSLVLPLPDPGKPEQHEACCPLGKRFGLLLEPNKKLSKISNINIHDV